MTDIFTVKAVLTNMVIVRFVGTLDVSRLFVVPLPSLPLWAGLASGGSSLPFLHRRD